MASTGVKRKLTTILAADVEGYSRMMGADEEATLETLKAYREIIDGLMVRHDGRVFSTAGDSVLAEFTSAVEAVRAAISIQEELGSRNAALAEEQRMRFRIGINVGDVMIEGDDLFGDGVNVAARLQGLAEAGGVCVSGSVFDQVKGKLSAGFEDIGAKKVKNIAEPVPAYRVMPTQGAPAAAGGTPSATRRRRRIPALVAVLVAIIALGGVALWWPWAPEHEPASLDQMAFKLPDKPSIAVLPFINLSGDKAQEYFADGLTEDIITSLASFPNLFVIARTSTNKFKGKAVDIRDVAHDLGVRYVLEGSVRRAGNTLRITAQLIDALSGNHIWAAKYDRELKDIFALQDEITGEIGSMLVSKVAAAEWRRRLRKGTRNAEAYDLILRASATGLEFNPRANARAIQLVEQAIEKDPKFSRAYAQLAFLRRNNFIFRWAKGPKDTLSHALELARKAVALDPRDSNAYRMLSFVYQSQGQHDRSIEAAEKAISLSPSNPDAMMGLAFSLAFSGRGEEAVRQAERGMRLNPHGHWGYQLFAGFAYYMAKRYDKAAVSFERARRLNRRTFVPIVWSAAAHAQLGRMDEARSARQAAIKLRPAFTIQRFFNRSGVKGKFWELALEGFRKAGFPENPPPGTR